LILTVLIFLSYLFVPQIVKLFASGFDSYTTAKAIDFSRIMIFGIYSMVLVNIFSSILQYNNVYFLPAFTGILMNSIVIVSIYFSWIFQNLIILSIGTLFSMIAQVFILLPIIRRYGIELKFKFDLNDVNIRKMIYLSIPVIAGVAVNEINVLVDRTIASSISVGGISALNYANKLNGFIYGIFVFSISTVLYPTIIKKLNDKDNRGFLKSFRESIFGVNLFVIPATVGLMVLSEPIIKFLYGRGAFNQEAIALTASALFFYSFGIVGVSLRQIIVKVFYAIQDTKTPMLNASLGLIINIVLNLILSKYLGIGGLALATSISAIFTTIILFISLRVKIGPLGLKQIGLSFSKLLLASLMMGGIAKLTYVYFSTYSNQNFSLLLSINVGAIFYFLILYFMKIDEVDIFSKAIIKKIIDLSSNKTS
jgi:putative peptidoglycan lipid II flippase